MVVALQVPASSFWEANRSVLLGASAILALVAIWLVVRYSGTHPAVRALLGDFATGTDSVAIFLRGLFATTSEFFSRAPADPRNPSAGLTVLKWGKIAEVHSAPDIKALGSVLQLLQASNRRFAYTLLSGEPSRQRWSQDAVTVGPHYLAFQILDTCEPRLVALRQPDGIRALVSQQLFEAKDGQEYGLIYKGRHPATHRTFMVIMGLGDLGTVAAAAFLQLHARSLGHLAGGKPFAAIIGANPASGPERAILKSLQPPPSWWRKWLYRKRWRELGGIVAE